VETEKTYDIERNQEGKDLLVFVVKCVGAEEQDAWKPELVIR